MPLHRGHSQLEIGGNPSQMFVFVHILHWRAGAKTTTRTIPNIPPITPQNLRRSPPNLTSLTDYCINSLPGLPLTGIVEAGLSHASLELAVLDGEVHHVRALVLRAVARLLPGISVARVRLFSCKI